jgi:Na+/phosphate symporter
VIAVSNVGALRDPKQWRVRAERIRNVAVSVSDPVRRRSMLDIADKYERVGKFIERQRLDLLKQLAAPSTRERTQ